MGRPPPPPRLRPHERARARTRDVAKSFGRTEIIRGVSLTIGAGERHAIIGPNGAGKIDPVQPDQRRLTPTAGEIRLGGRRIDGLRPYEINRRGLSRSFQVTNVFPQPDGLGEPALRDALGDRAPLRVLDAACRTAAT